MNNNNIIVSIICLAYNHEQYIGQCLEGFVMQKTDFAYEVIIHDDASTDNTATIIKEYELKYPHIIKPIYQKENQYSKGVKIGQTYLYPKVQGKYIAECEGDDYWIDPLKLQKQVDFLEKSSEYIMCCSDAVIQTNNGILEWCRYPHNQDVKLEDIIINGGWFLQTATLIYRKELLSGYPDFCRKCHVGDYPLMLWAGVNGKIFWMAEKQVVYRYSIGNSWTSTYNKQELANKIKGWRSEIDMLQGLDDYSNNKYHFFFVRRQVDFIRNILLRNKEHHKKISLHFLDIKKKYNLKEKIVDFLIEIHLYDSIQKIKSLISIK